MSEFDTIVADDPAAEFLAREQNALAELDDEFDFAHTNSNVNITQSMRSLFTFCYLIIICIILNRIKRN